MNSDFEWDPEKMKKNSIRKQDDYELREEYDLSKMTKVSQLSHNTSG